MHSCEIPLTYRDKAVLIGRDRDLVSVRLSVEPRSLEEVLETLANLDFPVDPHIIHEERIVCVEFRSSRPQAAKVRSALAYVDSGAERVEILAI